MAEICCGVVSDSDSSAGGDSASRAARKRRIEIRPFKFLPPEEEDENSGGDKREDCNNEEEREENTTTTKKKCIVKVGGGSDGKLIEKDSVSVSEDCVGVVSVPALEFELGSNVMKCPKFGVASVCGRRRDMEDAVAIRPRLFHRDGGEISSSGSELHYFGVYDGHGCSHVAVRCSERLHELVKEELESGGGGGGGGGGEKPREWKGSMERSFVRMDEEVAAWTNETTAVANASCRCELQTPDCDAVGSTAVVAIVTPDNIIVANCGDSRAVLSRNGKAIALSSDHKPDRPDELDRIQAAGGRVIYWEGPRVLGVLAMSRAIGDNYLKPYVSSEPEVTVIDRTDEDDCLILASDGLWDVVSNETACGVARMCLQGKGPVPSDMVEDGEEAAVGSAEYGGETSDKACSDASLLLTKLALARLSTDNVSVVVVDLRKTDT